MDENGLEAFAAQFSMIKSEKDYAVLLDRFGVWHTNKDFGALVILFMTLIWIRIQLRLAILILIA